MAKSKHEALFDLLWREVGGEPFVREHRFDPERRWRFDFAWPEHRVAVELEGSTWVNGRHNRGSGFEKDCEKYNRATQLNWRVLRYTGTMLRKQSAEVIDQLTSVLNGRNQ